mmetsp:Transcript_41048/g.162300  ORF Transcript_41048/g.162300 Transcript_41048/m.162300 type:complete len:83 (-) Transcript_41048:517-765(-)
MVVVSFLFFGSIDFQRELVCISAEGCRTGGGLLRSRLEKEYGMGFLFIISIQSLASTLRRRRFSIAMFLIGFFQFVLPEEIR